MLKAMLTRPNNEAMNKLSLLVSALLPALLYYEYARHSARCRSDGEQINITRGKSAFRKRSTPVREMCLEKTFDDRVATENSAHLRFPVVHVQS